MIMLCAKVKVSVMHFLTFKTGQLETNIALIFWCDLWSITNFLFFMRKRIEIEISTLKLGIPFLRCVID